MKGLTGLKREEHSVKTTSQPRRTPDGPPAVLKTVAQ